VRTKEYRFACMHEPPYSSESIPSNRRIALNNLAISRLRYNLKKHYENSSKCFIKISNIIPSEKDISIMVDDYRIFITECDKILNKKIKSTQ
jgi:hypothetical protein